MQSQQHTCLNGSPSFTGFAYFAVRGGIAQYGIQPDGQMTYHNLKRLNIGNKQLPNDFKINPQNNAAYIASDAIYHAHIKKDGTFDLASKAEPYWSINHKIDITPDGKQLHLLKSNTLYSYIIAPHGTLHCTAVNTEVGIDKVALASSRGPAADYLYEGINTDKGAQIRIYRIDGAGDGAQFPEHIIKLQQDFRVTDIQTTPNGQFVFACFHKPNGCYIDTYSPSGEALTFKAFAASKLALCIEPSGTFAFVLACTQDGRHTTLTAYEISDSGMLVVRSQLLLASHPVGYCIHAESGLLYITLDNRTVETYAVDITGGLHKLLEQPWPGDLAQFAHARLLAVY